MKIGIIGGGQLALMMIQSHPEHEYYVIEPKVINSVSKFANVINTQYDDRKSLLYLMNKCEVITYEFENISSKALSLIESKLNPNKNLLTISQNRIKEKICAKEIGVPIGLFHVINSIEQLQKILDSNNSKWVLKTTTGGYDGKGQIVIKDKIITNDIQNLIKNNESILEKWIDFEYETSIIITRNKKGEYVYIEPTTNIHRDNILWITHNFNKIRYINQMVKHCKNLTNKLKVVGTLAVEFFITKEGPLFNEMAPRPHNSGHWSIEGTTASQFVNHINSITSQKLVKPKNIGYTAMINLLGNDYINAKENIVFNNNVYLHDYFKDKVIHNRKMGHITINYPTKKQAINKLQEIKKLLS